MRRYGSPAQDVAPGPFYNGSPTQARRGYQPDTHGTKSKKSWGERLKLAATKHEKKEKESVGLDKDPYLLQEYRNKYGTLSSGSALSKSMKYAETWLYGTVDLRSQTNSQRPSLFVYPPGGGPPPRTVFHYPSSPDVSQQAQPALILYPQHQSGCPSSHNSPASGTTKLRHSHHPAEIQRTAATQPPRKSASPQHGLYLYPVGVDCKREPPTVALCSCPQFMEETVRGRKKGGPILCKACGGSRLVLGGTARLCAPSERPRACDKNSNSNPYDLMRRNRLGSITPSEEADEDVDVLRRRRRTRSTSPSSRYSSESLSSTADLRLACDRYDLYLSDSEAVDDNGQSKRKSILECDVSAYELIAKYLKNGGEMPEALKTRMDRVESVADGSDDDEFSDSLSDNVLEDGSDTCRAENKSPSQTSKLYNNVSRNNDSGTYNKSCLPNGHAQNSEATGYRQQGRNRQNTKTNNELSKKSDDHHKDIGTNDAQTNTNQQRKIKSSLVKPNTNRQKMNVSYDDPAQEHTVAKNGNQSALSINQNPTNDQAVKFNSHPPGDEPSRINSSGSTLVNNKYTSEQAQRKTSSSSESCHVNGITIAGQRIRIFGNEGNMTQNEDLGDEFFNEEESETVSNSRSAIPRPIRPPRRGKVIAEDENEIVPRKRTGIKSILKKSPTTFDDTETSEVEYVVAAASGSNSNFYLPTLEEFRNVKRKKKQVQFSEDHSLWYLSNVTDESCVKDLLGSASDSSNTQTNAAYLQNDKSERSGYVDCVSLEESHMQQEMLHRLNDNTPTNLSENIQENPKTSSSDSVCQSGVESPDIYEVAQIMDKKTSSLGVCTIHSADNSNLNVAQSYEATSAISDSKIPRENSSMEEQLQEQPNNEDYVKISPERQEANTSVKTSIDSNLRVSVHREELLVEAGPVSCTHLHTDKRRLQESYYCCEQCCSEHYTPAKAEDGSSGTGAATLEAAAENCRTFGLRRHHSERLSSSDRRQAEFHTSTRLKYRTVASPGQLFQQQESTSDEMGRQGCQSRRPRDPPPPPPRQLSPIPLEQLERLNKTRSWSPPTQPSVKKHQRLSDPGPCLRLQVGPERLPRGKEYQKTVTKIENQGFVCNVVGTNHVDDGKIKFTVPDNTTKIAVANFENPANTENVTVTSRTPSSADGTSQSGRTVITVSNDMFAFQGCNNSGSRKTSIIINNDSPVDFSSNKLTINVGLLETEREGGRIIASPTIIPVSPDQLGISLQSNRNVVAIIGAETASVTEQVSTDTFLLDPVEAVKRNLVPHVCGKKQDCQQTGSEKPIETIKDDSSCYTLESGAPQVTRSLDMCEKCTRSLEYENTRPSSLQAEADGLEVFDVPKKVENSRPASRLSDYDDVMNTASYSVVVSRETVAMQSALIGTERADYASVDSPATRHISCSCQSVLPLEQTVIKHDAEACNIDHEPQKTGANIMSSTGSGSTTPSGQAHSVSCTSTDQNAPQFGMDCDYSTNADQSDYECIGNTDGRSEVVRTSTTAQQNNKSGLNVRGTAPSSTEQSNQSQLPETQSMKENSSAAHNRVINSDTRSTDTAEHGGSPNNGLKTFCGLARRHDSEDHKTNGISFEPEELNSEHLSLSSSNTETQEQQMLSITPDEEEALQKLYDSRSKPESVKFSTTEEDGACCNKSLPLLDMNDIEHVIMLGNDSSTSDENLYESIKDHIYEEIPDTPPPLPLSPPPCGSIADSNRNSKSIFEGASKYDILSYLAGAKERGLAQEDGFYQAGSDVSCDLSRVSQLSNGSDTSEDSIVIAGTDIKARKSSVDIERNDSGVGSETSKSSRSRWQHCAGNVDHLCEDCDQLVETEVTDSGVMYAPLVCRKCAKKRAERKEIIAEIVETEEKYGRDLKIIMEQFYRPMLVAGLLTPEQLSAIFLNVEELLDHNANLAEKMRDTLEIAVEQGDEDLTTVNIGRLFLDAAPMLHAFETYCTKQGGASVLLANLEKDKELLRIFLRVSQMENAVLRRMNLNSFLMVPVQRVTKYPLLLARLYKVTPSHLEGRELLRDAQHKVELHLEHMNSVAKDISTTKLWRRISSINGRRTSSESDMINIKLRKMALDLLEWSHDEVRFAMEGRLLCSNPTDSNWRRGRTIKLQPVNALLVTNGKPTEDYHQDPTEAMLMFPRKNGVKDATLLLLREKGGRFTLLREPMYLDKCIVCCDMDFEEYFEVQELSTKETYIFKAEDGARTKMWYRQMQYHAQGLGVWRRRRNALANIMINGMFTRS